MSGAQYVGNLTYFAGVLCKQIMGLYFESFSKTEIREKSEAGSILIMGKWSCSEVKSKPFLASHIMILLSSDPKKQMDFLNYNSRGS